MKEKYFVCDRYAEGENIQLFETFEEAQLYANVCIQQYREDAVDAGAWLEDVEGIYIGNITHKIAPEIIQKRSEVKLKNNHDEEGNYWVWGAGDWLDYSMKKVGVDE